MPVACLREGEDAVLVTYGMLINETLAAAQTLSARGIQAAVYKINELTALQDAEMLAHIARCGTLIVVEEVVQAGGVGEALTSLLAARGTSLHGVKLLNTGDRFLPCGSVRKMYEICHLDAEGIIGAVMEAKTGE